MPPLPPILVPGVGLLAVPQALDLLAPPLAPEEGIYLNSLMELTAALTGVKCVNCGDVWIGVCKASI